MQKAECTEAAVRDMGNWELDEGAFSERSGLEAVRKAVIRYRLPLTGRGLDYAVEKHAGQYRKHRAENGERIPYIVHPVTMCCQALAMGVRDDEILCTALLHDVCEDCGVSPEDLPFPESVRHSVTLLTRRAGDRRPALERFEEYYRGIRTDCAACLVKALDRCSNVSTMAFAFSGEKILEYIAETEDFVLPLLDCIEEQYPGYSAQAYLLRYHIVSVIESVKVLVQGQRKSR